jgi:hypothetical protein
MGCLFFCFKTMSIKKNRQTTRVGGNLTNGSGCRVLKKSVALHLRRCHFLTVFEIISTSATPGVEAV